MTTPPASVALVAVNDYNIAVECRVWIHNEKTHVERRLELRERIFEALRGAHVDMPLQTIQLNSPAPMVATSLSKSDLPE